MQKSATHATLNCFFFIKLLYYQDKKPEQLFYFPSQRYIEIKSGFVLFLVVVSVSKNKTLTIFFVLHAIQIEHLRY